MSKFLDSEILNYTIKNLVSQIDKTFLKKKVLFNVTPAYYRLFDSTTDNPSDKLTVIANGLTPTTGQVTSDTVRFITKNPSIYAVGAEVVFVEEVMTPKFDNVIGLTEQELDDIKALTPTDRADKYFSNILFVVDDTKLVFYDRTLDSFTDCTSGEKTIPQWEADHDYIVGDVVQESGMVYESIKDHTSTVFVDDKDNWVQVTKEYICCTKEQYDYLEVNDMLKGVLYIVDGIDEEEPISSANGSGSATLTQDIIANTTVGNITAGYVFKAGMTFDEYVRAVHVSHLAPVVNLTLNPSATIYRKGDTIDTLDVIATITKKSSDIDNIRYYVGGVLVNTKDNTTDSGLANGGIYTYKYENTITDNTEIKVIVNDGKTNITKTTKIEFVNPIYIGLSSDTTLTSVLQNKGTYVYRDITCTDASVIFKYPKSYGELTSIKDPNGFENLDSFTQTIEEIHGEDYYVYTNEPSTLDGFTYTFTF